jgi:hypothetical protein
MITVKNIDIESRTWCGMLIAPSATYEIQDQELSKWQTNSDVIVSIATGELAVVHNGSEIVDVATAMGLLKPVAPTDSTGTPIVRSTPFSDSGGFRFRGCSFTGSSPTGTATPIDFKIENERYVNGGFLIVDKIGSDDRMTFQVVDKDNVLGYGFDVVLDEFIKDFYIPTKSELNIALDYPARINAGLYLRMIYTSTHADGANIKCNLYLHWKQL